MMLSTMSPRSAVTVLVALSGTCGLTASAAGQESGEALSACAPAGLDIPCDMGPNRGIRTAAAFDDGTGMAVYAAGRFTQFGCVPVSKMARWDGTAWGPVDALLQAQLDQEILHIENMIAYDDGVEAALYMSAIRADGSDGLGAYGLYRWDGAVLEQLFEAPEAPVGFEILDELVVGDLGGRPVLAAVGTREGGQTLDGDVFIWDGESLVHLDDDRGPLNSVITHLTFSDDELYIVGAFFSTTNGMVGEDLGFAGIARWDGSRWQPPMSSNGPVTARAGGTQRLFAVASLDDGSGAQIYAGGLGEVALDASGERLSGLIRLGPDGWEPAPGAPEGLTDIVWIGALDEPGGPRLSVSVDNEGAPSGVGYLLGTYDGTAWEEFAVRGARTRFGNAVYVADLGDGAAVYAEDFVRRAGSPVWEPLFGEETEGFDVHGADPVIRAIATFDDGRGEALYVAGAGFDHAGTASVANIARWDGDAWEGLGDLPDVGTNPDAVIRELASARVGASDELVAAGDFDRIGAADARGLASWDGTRWAPFDAGDYREIDIRDLSNAELVGPGGLIVAGEFSGLGAFPVLANGVARWDGQAWHPLGQEGAGPVGPVNAVAEFDDGSGPRLFAAGDFTQVIGEPGLFSNIAAWDGQDWTGVGDGLPGTAFDLAVFDDGDGPDLYAAIAAPRDAGGVTWGLERWDGQSWTRVDVTFNNVGIVGSAGLLAVDTAEGELLFLTGGFIQVNGQTTPGIAAFDGTAWAPVPWPEVADFRATAMAAWDDGTGPRVFIHASYTTSSSPRALGSSILPFDPCVFSCTADFDMSGSVDILDVIAFVTEWQSAGTRADFNEDGAVNVLDVIGFITVWNAGCA